MPRQVTQLQVFVASPNDVQPERDVLDHVVAELNALWSRTLGISLDVIRWETHTYPAQGSDPQSVINAQIPDDYDLLVVILWTRIGTSTPRAASGTVEEFERALARYRADKSSVELMVFFKDAPVSPSQIDPEQLAGVNDFRVRVEAEGGLHRTFTDASDFETALRFSLTQHVLKWRQARESTSPSTASAAGVAEGGEPPATEPNEDEPGLLDLIEAVTDASDELVQVSERMGAALAEFARDIDSRTKEVNEARESGSVKLMKRATNRVAEDMDRFVALMRVEIPEFTRNYDLAFAGATKMASIALDAGGSSRPVAQMRELANMMHTLHGVFLGTAQSTAGLRDVIAATPRLTTVYNRSRKVTIEVLTSLVTEFEGAAGAASQAEATVRAVIGHPEEGDAS